MKLWQVAVDIGNADDELLPRAEAEGTWGVRVLGALGPKP